MGTGSSRVPTHYSHHRIPLYIRIPIPDSGFRFHPVIVRNYTNSDIVIRLQCEQNVVPTIPISDLPGWLAAPGWLVGARGRGSREGRVRSWSQSVRSLYDCALIIRHSWAVQIASLALSLPSMWQLPTSVCCADLLLPI